METVRAYIFDVDGTLIDSVDAHADAWTRAFSQFGIECAYADVRAQVGKGSDQFLPVFLTVEQLRHLGHKIEKRHDEFFQDGKASLKPFEGVRELLLRLRKEGMRIAVASSGSSADVAYFKRLANIDSLIDAVITSEDAKRSKPAPDIYRTALERLEISAESALAVGDTVWDVIAASAAGVTSIGFLCGGSSRTSLLDAGCVEIFDGPLDMLQSLERVDQLRARQVP